MSNFTADDLARINKAIANGVKQVQFKDRTVDYRSMNEMLRVRDLIQTDVHGVKRPNRVVASMSKGLAK